jgi:hypothetical protein
MVHGSLRMSPLMRISRNMAIVRDGGELTLINAVRVSADTEAELEDLGTIRNVMRLGYYHGVDDPYYVDRYSARFWCQADSDHHSHPELTDRLEEGADLPVRDGELFVFRQAMRPESALLIHRHGGILITCDSIQHYADWNYCSIIARVFMRATGFSLTTLIGPLWLRYMTPRGGSLRSDFERLLERDFEHLISAHGQLLRNGARSSVQAAVQRAFGGSGG